MAMEYRPRTLTLLGWGKVRGSMAGKRMERSATASDATGCPCQWFQSIGTPSPAPLGLQPRPQPPSEAEIASGMTTRASFLDIAIWLYGFDGMRVLSSG